MASSSTAVATGRDGSWETVEKERDSTKIRISNIGGRYLVFDVADVAHLRRQHSMCAILVGITPQAPNQNVFSSLPLELTADEVRWLVHERRAAYVADDLRAHLASLSQPAARSAYLESVQRQRQAAQALADEVAAQRERRGAEVRANMAAKRAQQKSKKAANKAASKPATSKDEADMAKDTEKAKQPAQTEAQTQDHTEPEPEPEPKPEPVIEKAEEEARSASAQPETLDKAPINVAAAVAPIAVPQEAVVTTAEQQKDSEAQGETSTLSPAKEKKAVAAKASSLVRITPTTSAGLVGGDDDAENNVDAAAEVTPAPAAALSPSTLSAASLRAHLANRGYYTTPGLRFGGALSVYPGDPFRYHAHFVATTYGWDEPIQLLDIVSQGRLATSVKKGLLIGGAKPAETGGADGEASVRTFTLEWAAI
ncbi:MAG: tRNA-splicing endonuclease subunit [Sporothrix thermara]